MFLLKKEGAFLEVFYVKRKFIVTGTRSQSLKTHSD